MKRSRKLTRQILCVSLMVPFAAALGLALPTPVQASHCVSDQRLQVIHVKEDAFWNYDFESEDVDRCNVDWPVNLIFHGNAEIDRVKRDMLLYAGYSCVSRGDCGKQFHARMSDGVDMSWDADAGIKAGLCGGDATHLRLYAAGETDIPDGHDRMFNLRWGFYILGTSHIDHADCWPVGRWSGRSERAEGNIARAVRPIWHVGSRRAPVREDAVNLANRTLPCRQAGPHILCSDGRATTALVAP